MTKPQVMIAGGGIGGMVMALTLHQIGVGCVVNESVPELLPLGVGINLQPNAVRELYDLGIDAQALDRIGLQAREWALVGLNGNDIYAENRGLAAGYHWPQYAVHRGKLQMLLYQTVVDRVGHDAVRLGQRVTGYEQNTDGTVTVDIKHVNGSALRETGTILIGADGLHSAIRAQMHPDQPPVHWGGAVMWRGTSPGIPIRSGSSFVGLGTHRHRLVFYPISNPDATTGLSMINWIAEVTFDGQKEWRDGDWNRQVTYEEFGHYFEGWTYDWLDVPALLKGGSKIYEYPMIDRDPIPYWQDGNVVLMGDAAHVMYPTGSNGASQAIVDARVMGKCFVDLGVNRSALEAYNQLLCEPVSNLVLRNRGAGPFEILELVDQRCGGKFDNIDDVIAPEELQNVMAKYKKAAGLAIESLNQADPTIPKGAKA